MHLFMSDKRLSQIIMTFDFNSPGANTKLRSYKKRETKERIRKVIHAELWKHGMPNFESATVIYRRYSRQVMDKDNCYFSAKVWIDRLVEYGVIKDDNPKYLDLQCESIQGKARTEIIIERK